MDGPAPNIVMAYVVMAFCRHGWPGAESAPKTCGAKSARKKMRLNVNAESRSAENRSAASEWEPRPSVDMGDKVSSITWGNGEHMSKHMYKHMSEHMSKHISTCLNTCLDTCLNTCLDTCLNTCLNTHMSKHMSKHAHV